MREPRSSKDFFVSRVGAGFIVTYGPHILIMFYEFAFVAGEGIVQSFDEGI
jgi:hypothetical protein